MRSTRVTHVTQRFGVSRTRICDILDYSYIYNVDYQLSIVDYYWCFICV